MDRNGKHSCDHHGLSNVSGFGGVPKPGPPVNPQLTDNRCANSICSCFDYFSDEPIIQTKISESNEKYEETNFSGPKMMF